jgi:hypothetical protein
MKLKLFNNPLSYLGFLILGIGVLVASFSDKAELAGAVLGQAGIIICFLGYRKTRIAGGETPAQEKLRQKTLVAVIAIFCACLVVTPIALWLMVPKLPSIITLETIIAGVAGCLGLLWLFFWRKKRN